MTVARLAPPWYVHPAEDAAAWRALADHRPRPSFIVVNVHDGPGKPDDPWYPSALAQLRGLRLLGYVDAAYGERPPAEVLADVRTWRTLYGIGGVMLDRTPSTALATGRLSEYVSDARRAGAAFVVGNPGVPPALGHLALFDVTCVFEGSSADYGRFQPSSGLRRVPRSRIWHLVHTCPEEEAAAVTARAARLGAGHVFVTDRGLPNPWEGFPLAGSMGGGAA